ncbi:MAG: hypothetical protein ACTSQO_14960 [Candidatus Helarchaeota archaeon]
MMTPKKCMLCEKFKKLKQFENMRSQFHNWCEKYHRPVALVKCNGSELAVKYLENDSNQEIDANKDNIYEIFKVQIDQF